MPVSKTHQKRKLKKKKRKDSFDSLIKKRVKAFNQLPEEERVALLTRWKNTATPEEVHDAPSGKATDG